MLNTANSLPNLCHMFLYQDKQRQDFVVNSWRFDTVFQIKILKN